MPRILRETIEDANLVSSELESKSCLLNIAISDAKPENDSVSRFFPREHWEQCSLKFDSLMYLVNAQYINFEELLNVYTYIYVNISLFSASSNRVPE